ncbi:murein biosynthesis integral membrane protein MurJ [Dyella mobilis]|uniref:Probable lipid II flippase MurJ n=1 Tax=Dyella mobilis TaxID=1849582 RepID=A0ABS2KKJ2_9GAMM|nr:murein biosynthesis integral membrane protein MurJ [Dyella mobilis]MBM7131609.1 murein biosynthesis integral membrane protein MurJ [Dyella mobilis]GLQ96415.1 lipid II flippase MurJ [Dyella mobilis]
MTKEAGRGHALLVGAGILCSRLFGLVRQRVFSHYFGLSDAADIFSAALRVPNFLQNLFGEGVLSASFIPVYARLLAQHKQEEADRLAGAIAAALALIIAVIVALGVWATPSLLWLIAPGYVGEKRELTILIVRILFPGTGILVWSAWCLGILNSHHKFFLSYAAPVVWNLSMILTMLFFRHLQADRLIVYLAWGTVLGCLLQFLVQLGPVLKLVPGMRLRMDLRNVHVRQVGGSFLGVAVGRGVVQISAFVDQAISTLLGSGAIAGMTTASSINLLPVSLFGMAISASELPTLSRMAGDEMDGEVSAKLSQRLNNGLERIAFFIVPSAMAFFALGNVVVAALYQSGAFTAKDSHYVWAILAGSGVGLLATTFGRLYSSTYYAMRDTRTPLRFAIVRLAFTAALGLASALLLPGVFGIPLQWGAVGLTASAGVAGWIEFHLLRRTLNKRIGATGVPMAMMAKLWASASLSALAACAVEYGLPLHGPIVTALFVLATYGVAYFGITYGLRIKTSVEVLEKILRRLGVRGKA